MADWMSLCGTAVAFLGASLAVGLPCSGSAIGVGTVGQAGAGIISVDPDKFSRALILQIIPGTQGLYGLVVWSFAMMKLGFFSNEAVAALSIQDGLRFFGACMPISIGGLICGIVMGRIGAGGLSLLAKRGAELSKSILMMVMMEFYAILCLLASILMLIFFQPTV